MTKFWCILSNKPNFVYTADFGAGTPWSLVSHNIVKCHLIFQQLTDCESLLGKGLKRIQDQSHDASKSYSCHCVTIDEPFQECQGFV